MFNLLWSLYQIFNDSALICAAVKDNTDIIRLLLTQKDININTKGVLMQKTS